MSTLNGQHYYYGNIKAQTDNWDRDTIGVSYNYLKNYGLSESHPYNGKKCIIRKGTHIISPPPPGRPKSAFSEVVESGVL